MTPRVRARRAVATNFQFVSTFECDPGLPPARRGPASPHTQVFSQTGWKPIPRAVATNFQFVSTIERDPGLPPARRGPASPHTHGFSQTGWKPIPRAVATNFQFVEPPNVPRLRRQPDTAQRLLYHRHAQPRRITDRFETYRSRAGCVTLTRRWSSRTRSLFLTSFSRASWRSSLALRSAAPSCSWP
jgi:hypothetical protein